MLQLLTRAKTYIINSGGGISVSGVTVTPSSATISNNNTVQLIRVILPQNASDQTGTWSSDNPSLVTVNSNGLVTSDIVGTGTTTVTFTTSNGGFTASCDVLVENPVLVTGVTVSPSVLNITTGNTSQLLATIDPENAVDQTGTWSSNDTNIVTVTTNGVVSAITSGSTSVVFTTNDGGFTDSTTVNVFNNIPVSGVTVSPSNITLNSGGTSQLLVTIEPQDATDQTGTWSSNDTNIATVDSNGVVTAQSTTGTTSVIYTTNDGGFTGETTVTVEVGIFKAFPTALGAAAYAREDTTYSLYEVTNVNPTGAGSLYDGLGNNRIIVFRASGIINLDGIFTTQTFSNCIVLGQTAPLGGITISGNGWRWDGCNNVIFRYVKFRTWQCQADVFAPCSADAIDMLNCDNVIFDHCSFAFGGDETLSFRADSRNITAQNCIFAYGNAGMLAGDSDDTTRGFNFSILHNLWHTLGKRTPNPNSNGRIDNVGNVTYNILNLLSRSTGSIKLNEIGNDYNRSGRSRLNFGGGAVPLIHTSNNRFNDSITGNSQDNTVMWLSWLGGRDPIPSDFTGTPFPLINYDLPLPDGDDSFLKAQNREMGANKYLDNNGDPVLSYDDVDLSAYTQFDNDEFFDWDDGTGNSTQGSWRIIPQRQWLEDNRATMGTIVNEHSQTTHTGVVPNVWITNEGLSPGTFNPLNNDLHPTYTNIEVYSHQVDSGANSGVTISVSGVSITPSATTIGQGLTEQLTANFDPVDASDRSGTWSSNNPSIATVNSSGLVSGVTTGDTSIVFTTNDGGFTGSTDVTVITIPVSGVTVSPSAVTINQLSTTQLSETVTPLTATDKTGTWSSNNPSIATVNSGGLVSGVTTGDTSIVFTTNDGGFTGSTDVTVTEPFNSGLILNGIFDDDTNVLVDAFNAWEITGGVASFDDSRDNSPLIFTTNTITAGDYTLTFDIPSGSNPRFAVNVGATNVVGTTFYAVANDQTVNISYSGSNVTELTILASNSAGAGPFDLDNVSLFAD